VVIDDEQLEEKNSNLSFNKLCYKAKTQKKAYLSKINRREREERC
jgi:queuine/archaeosine tRNA-ribosyltransferase